MATASSPWWAWPLNLKPVWYYQDSFAGATTGEIYDSGNLVIFWMGIPALILGAIAAWRRRSLPLTLILLLFLAMWLPWVRIDRASGKRVFGVFPTKEDPRSPVIWEAFQPQTEPRRTYRRSQGDPYGDETDPRQQQLQQLQRLRQLQQQQQQRSIASGQAAAPPSVLPTQNTL